MTDFALDVSDQLNINDVESTSAQYIRDLSDQLNINDVESTSAQYIRDLSDTLELDDDNTEPNLVGYDWDMEDTGTSYWTTGKTFFGAGSFTKNVAPNNIFGVRSGNHYCRPNLLSTGYIITRKSNITLHKGYTYKLSAWTKGVVGWIWIICYNVAAGYFTSATKYAAQNENPGVSVTYHESAEFTITEDDTWGVGLVTAGGSNFGYLFDPFTATYDNVILEIVGRASPTFYYNAEHVDNLGIDDSIAKGVDKTLDDTLNIDDPISKGVAKPFSDNLSLDDSIVKSPAKNLSDNLEISEPAIMGYMYHYVTGTGGRAQWSGVLREFNLLEPYPHWDETSGASGSWTESTPPTSDWAETSDPTTATWAPTIAGRSSMGDYFETRWFIDGYMKRANIWTKKDYD